MSDSRLTIGLGEYDTGWHDPAASIAGAERLVRRMAGVGVDLVVLPEMATTGFTMESERAVPLDSPDVAALSRIARQSNVWLIAGVALRGEGIDGMDGGAVNASLAIDPSGEIAAVHRKQRLFAYGGEHESYVPGETSTVVKIGGVRVGLFICYELRFPELFGAVARDVNAMVLIANWPASRQEHWDSLLRARAIENQCYMVGVNRTGVANGLSYVGGSTVFDPWGDRLNPSPSGTARIVSIDGERTGAVRAKYPFLGDRCGVEAMVAG